MPICLCVHAGVMLILAIAEEVVIGWQLNRIRIETRLFDASTILAHRPATLTWP